MVLVHNGIGTYGTGAQCEWDTWYWYSMGLGHMVLVRNVIGTYGTGAQWDWDIWYWYTMGLGHMVLEHCVSET